MNTNTTQRIGFWPLLSNSARPIGGAAITLGAVAAALTLLISWLLGFAAPLNRAGTVWVIVSLSATCLGLWRVEIAANKLVSGYGAFAKLLRYLAYTTAPLAAILFVTAPEMFWYNPGLKPTFRFVPTESMLSVYDTGHCDMFAPLAFRNKAEESAYEMYEHSQNSWLFGATVVPAAVAGSLFALWLAVSGSVWLTIRVAQLLAHAYGGLQPRLPKNPPA